MKLLQWLCIGTWFFFTIWIFTYEMYVSFLYAVLILWALLPREKPKRWPRITIFVLYPFVFWNVGLVEYGLQTIDLHCRTLGFTGAKEESFCAYQPEAYTQGKQHTEGPLFSTLEHMGVHGFNFMLATGGFIAGLPEVAWETFYLSFAKDPSSVGMANENKKTRTKQCTQPQIKSTTSGNGDVLLTSTTIRQILAKDTKKAQQAKDGAPQIFPPTPVNFTANIPKAQIQTNNDLYGNLSDNLRIVLALLVPNANLHVEGQYTPQGNILDVMWKGDIFYPSTAFFEFDIPTIYQIYPLSSLTGVTTRFPIILSEGMFCGMAIDGAMNPYTQTWKIKVPVDDERLGDSEKMQYDQGFFEKLIVSFL